MDRLELVLRNRLDDAKSLAQQFREKEMHDSANYWLDVADTLWAILDEAGLEN